MQQLASVWNGYLSWPSDLLTIHLSHPGFPWLVYRIEERLSLSN